MARKRKPRAFLWGDVVFGVLGAAAVLFLAISYFSSREPSAAEVYSDPSPDPVSYAVSVSDSHPDPVPEPEIDTSFLDRERAESEARVARERERESQKDKKAREALRKELSSIEKSLSSVDPDSIPMLSTPNSSCFSSIGYDAGSETLKVTFLESGISYLYLGFPSSEWSAFSSADSLGGYYNSYIKGNYESVRLDD